MPRRPHPASATPDGVSPLPEKPNLEYERKRAKRFLRALRDGRADALEHARRRRVSGGGSASRWRLADAQLVVAREYGFASWPRLVEHFSTWERHDRAGPMAYSVHRDVCEYAVQRILRAHRERRPGGLDLLAAFVPRFYGMTDEEILATPLTEEEARLAVAREYRFPNWVAVAAFLDELDLSREGVDPLGKRVAPRGEGNPWAHLDEVAAATRADDREALARLIEAHPELLGVDPPAPKHIGLLRSSLLNELRERTPAAREKTDWLVSCGADLAGTLNRMLASGPMLGPGAKAEDVAYLLERGADPAWVAPNGISVLEHALLRYWNPEAVDFIASRVTPRKAFWVAAGLGDISTMLGFLDQKGAPTEAARRDRPDFIAAGLPSPPCRPGAHALEVVWEAFFVAGINQRLAALDALLDRGFPVDAAPWGSTLLEWAEGNAKKPLADFLIEHGAQSRRE